MKGIITNAERKLYEWQYGTLGSFYKGLYTIISKADTKNKEKLRKAYPEEVKTITKYQEEEGYWEDVKLRMQLFINGDFNIEEEKTITIKKWLN